MNRVVLIACASQKVERAALAKDFYISPLFRANLAYARSLSPEEIFILSAKYGLVDLEQTLVPYDVTLNKMSEVQVRDWAGKVLEQLCAKIDLESTEIIFLAGEKYRKYLLPHLPHTLVPLAGLGIGKQLQWLKLKISNGAMRKTASIGK